jgi:two-component system cell cycle response regulator CpdR
MAGDSRRRALAQTAASVLESPLQRVVYQIDARFAWHRGGSIVDGAAGRPSADAEQCQARCATGRPLEMPHGLPADRPSDQHERRAMTAKPSCLPARRILLAEDDDSMRAFIERALVKAGYEVMSFGNGREAHERLRQEPFALLLTDIVMPQMDGIELARRASEIDPDLKIMFITGFAAVTLNTTTRAVRDAQVLSKPFHLKDLVREIDRLLAAPA